MAPQRAHRQVASLSLIQHAHLGNRGSQSSRGIAKAASGNHNTKRLVPHLPCRAAGMARARHGLTREFPRMYPSRHVILTAVDSNFSSALPCGPRLGAASVVLRRHLRC